MDVTQIPFNKFLGIDKCENPRDGLLLLGESAHYSNHLNTVHASAQFALGEAASGECMLQRFKDIAEREALIPVIRRAEIKYIKPGKGEIRASADIPDDVVAEALSAIDKKGKALIPVTVNISDTEGKVIMTATYEWFVQKDIGAR